MPPRMRILRSRSRWLGTLWAELKRHGRMADHPVIAGTRTFRLFGLGSGRSTLLWLSAGLVFLLGSSELAAANVAEALFVKRVGPTALPLAFIAEGILVLLALNYVGAAVDRGRRIETLRTLLIVAAATPLVL